MATKSYEQLTARQKAFVDAYCGVCHCNASASARQAGYNGRSNAAGHELLTNPDIRSCIDERMRALSIGPEEILFRLTAQARGNLKDLADAEGKLPETLEGLTHEQAAIIKKHAVKPGRHGTSVSIEVHDSQAALLALARRYGMLPEFLRIHHEVMALDDEALITQAGYGPVADPGE